MSPDAAFIACRFLRTASLMLVWGGAAYLAWLVPGGPAGIVALRLRRLFAVATAIAVATSLLALPIQTAGIGEGWADALDAGTVSQVLFDTTVGRAWQVQALAALLLALSACVGREWRLPALAVTGGLALASLALAGHAVMQDGALGAAHMANDALHLLAGGAWLGALVPLLPVLARLREAALRREAVAALRRFSNAGHVAVGVVILSGIGNMVLILGRLPTDWSSPYQALLAVKMAAVAAMTALAIVNRYVLVPRLSRSPAGVTRAIAISTIVEILLGVAAIGCVAVFGTLEPA